MTPKQKAKELVDRFWVYSLPNESGSWHNAKQCALIAVDEIIATDMLIDEDSYVETKSYLEYWEQVKQEIENL